MKLNLGSGNVEIGSAPSLEGFLRVDINPEVAPDILANVEDLETVASDSVEEIFASHIFEHLSHKSLALWEWKRVLMPGGLITVAIPDFIAGYALHRGGFWTTEWFNATIYGATIIGYPAPYEHKQVLSADMLLERMREVFPDSGIVTQISHRPIYIGEAVVQGHKS